MKSKEVEEAIKYCNLLLAGDITVHIKNEYGETEYAGDVDKQYNEDLKTVLEYIEELEKEVEKYMELSASSLARGLNESIRANEKNKTELELLNEGWKQKIRDKIKELDLNFKELSEEIDNKSNDMAYQNTMVFHKNIIKILKELLGE